MEMYLVWKLQNKIKASGLILMCIMLFAYFLFYTINGERGLFRYFYLKKEISQTQKIASQYNMKRTQLDEKVKLLSNKSLDLDLLDERVRTVLSFIDKDEFIIIDDSIE